MNSVLEQLAAATWQRLEHARRFDVRLGEETLTDILALELARSHSPHVKLLQTKKADEAVNGTDILMKIRISGRVHAFAIQAKKIGRLKEQYRSLNAPAGSTGRRQIDVLEFYATQIKARPMYLLYNHINALNSGIWRPPVWHCCRSLDQEQMGCTLVPAARIREVLTSPRGRRTFHHIHSNKDARPWRCIECPRGLRATIPRKEDAAKGVDAPQERTEPAERQEHTWPDWLWERSSDSPLSDDDLFRLHGQDVRLPDEPIADAVPLERVADRSQEDLEPDRADVAQRLKRPRLVPRRVLLIDQHAPD